MIKRIMSHTLKNYCEVKRNFDCPAIVNLAQIHDDTVLDEGFQVLMYCIIV